MEYNKNQNSYEELQTIVEAQQEKIDTLLTKLHKFRVLALDEELFNEVVASEGGEEKTKTFKLPEKWCIKDCYEVSDYAHKRFGCSSLISNQIFCVNENTNYYSFNGREGYEEISMEDFLQFVYPEFCASDMAEKTEKFTLDKSEIYSLEGTTEEQREKLLNWLKENDTGWDNVEVLMNGYYLVYNFTEWRYSSITPTKHIKNLI